MLGVAAFPALVRFVAFFFLPESPRWLVGVGKVSKARGILQRLRGREQNIEQELQEIRDDLEQSARENKQSEPRICLTNRGIPEIGTAYTILIRGDIPISEIASGPCIVY